MFHGLQKSLTYAVFCLCFFASAESVSAATWEQTFVDSIHQHADISTAKQEMAASIANANSLGQPLYNPELGGELENEGSDTNFRVGLSQGIDWWDRQTVSRQQGEFHSAQARYDFETFLQGRYAEGLRALAEWESARDLSALAAIQQQQQKRILGLIEQRQQAGDLGQVDTDLAYLGLIKKVAETALSDVELKRARTRVDNLLAGLDTPQAIPPRWWERIDALASNMDEPLQSLQSHPEVQSARAGWRRQQHSSRLTNLESKADPVFGIEAGTSGDDKVLALTFSMPLAIHNDFSLKVQAANQQALSAEAGFHAVMKNRVAQLQASHSIMLHYATRYTEWQDMLRGRNEQGDELLKRLWRSGEISTVEYITMLQQGSEALAAGIELKKQFDLSRIDWLHNTGRITELLNNQETNKQ